MTADIRWQPDRGVAAAAFRAAEARGEPASRRLGAPAPDERGKGKGGMVPATRGVAIEADPAGLRSRELADGEDRTVIRAAAGHEWMIARSGWERERNFRGASVAIFAAEHAE